MRNSLAMVLLLCVPAIGTGQSMYACQKGDRTVYSYNPCDSPLFKEIGPGDGGWVDQDSDRVKAYRAARLAKEAAEEKARQAENQRNRDFADRQALQDAASAAVAASLLSASVVDRLAKEMMDPVFVFGGIGRPPSESHAPRERPRR